MATNVGDRQVLTAQFRDRSGNLVDPTTVTCKVKSPSGATASYNGGSIVRISQGVYELTIDCTAGGKWIYRWSSTGTGKATVFGEFTVQRRPF